MTAGLAVKLLGAFAAFVVAVLLARALGPVGFGVYAFAFALVSVLGVPAQLGLPQLVVRQTAIAVEARDRTAVRHLWRWATGISLVLASVIVVVAAAAAWGFSEAGAARHTFWWALALVPLIAIGNIGAAAVRGLGAIVTGLAAENLLRPALFAILLAVMLASGQAVDASDAMAFHVAAAVGACLYAWHRALSLPVPTGGAESTTPPRGWLRGAFALGLVAAAHLINMRLDLLMVGLFLGSESVGQYQVAVTGANLVLLGASAAGVVAAPQFARLHARGATAELRAVSRRAARFALLACAPVVAAMVVFGVPLVSLAFGTEYTPAAAPLAWLAVAQAINAFFGPVGMLLNMTHHETATLHGVAAASAVNVILNLALIPSLGITGAAIATTISMVVWNVWLWRAAKRLLGIDSSAF